MVSNAGSIELLLETPMCSKSDHSFDQLFNGPNAHLLPISFFAFITHFSREYQLVGWRKTLMLI